MSEGASPHTGDVLDVKVQTSILLTPELKRFAQEVGRSLDQRGELSPGVRECIRREMERQEQD